MNQKKQKLKDVCDSSENLIKYLHEKAKNHNYYKIYTDRLDKIECIINQNCIYLSNGDAWNDEEDKADLTMDKEHCTFARCFSFSKSENVAMWMLYGGIGLGGYMINIPRKQMSELLHITKASIGYFENNSFVSKKELDVDKIQIKLCDMVYYNESEDGTVTIKRSDERVEGITTKILSELIGVKKKYPWCYENECRLIVKIPKNDVAENCEQLRLEFSQISDIDRVTICKSPNNEESNDYEYSTLRGKMNWKLCDCSCKKQKE